MSDEMKDILNSLTNKTIEEMAQRLKTTKANEIVRAIDVERRKENAQIRRNFREELRLSQHGIMPEPSLTKDEFTQQLYDPTIHIPTPDEPQRYHPPVHKNKEQKRLEKRLKRLAEKDAKEAAKPKKMTQAELFYSKFPRPAPRDAGRGQPNQNDSGTDASDSNGIETNEP